MCAVSCTFNKVVSRRPSTVACEAALSASHENQGANQRLSSLWRFGSKVFRHEGNIKSRVAPFCADWKTLKQTFDTRPVSGNMRTVAHYDHACHHYTTVLHAEEMTQFYILWYCSQCDTVTDLIEKSMATRLRELTLTLSLSMKHGSECHY